MKAKYFPNSSILEAQKQTVFRLEEYFGVMQTPKGGSFLENW
jgi:hypothetical protein